MAPRNRLHTIHSIGLTLMLALQMMALGLSAQELSFQGQAPRQVAVSQRFRLTYTLNADGSNFIGPEIKNFSVLQGPSFSTGQSITMINGKVDATSTTSASYILQATSAGTFTLPSAMISSNGKRLLSNTLTITVSNAGPNVPPQTQTPYPQQPGSPRSQSQPPQAEDNVGSAISLRATVDNANPYQGEPITLTYKLYTPTSRLSVGDLQKEPSFNGFWAQNLLKNATQFPQYTETVNGRKYIVAELGKYALVPQKSGALTIDPLNQDVSYEVQVRTRMQSPFHDDPFFKKFFDDSFFGSQSQVVRKTLKSNPVTVHVKSLPQASQPIDFTGAVGRFGLEASVDKHKLNANDALTLRVAVSGSGNINLLEKPDISFPPDFEVYDPKIIDNFRNTGNTSGTRTFEYIVIPRAAGKFTIPAVQYAYFDVGKNAYQHASSAPIDIEVGKGSGNANQVNPQQSVKLIANDIRFLKNTPLGLTRLGSSFFTSWAYWFLTLLMLALFGAYLWIWNRNNRNRSDRLLMQRLKATRIATKRLRKAKNLLDHNQHNAFHDELALAMWGYISDKFNIPLSELSLETARGSLQSRDVSPEITDRFMQVLNDSNFARYAPPGQALNMGQLYQMAMEAITNTEQFLK